MPGYDQIRTDVTLPQNESVTKAFTLEHTQAWKDSTEKVKKARYRRGRWVRRIGFGTLAIGFGAAGYYFNSKTSEYFDLYTNKQWDTSNNNSRPDYNVYWDNAEVNRKRRNAAYVAAGVCAAALGVSIRF
jgi:hypothetical protein